MENLFVLLAGILLVVTLLSIVTRFFKQPLIIAYIATGLALGPSLLHFITPSDTLATFAQIGVAFLLFIVGINLNFKVLKEVGFLALLLGITQVLATFFLGFFLVRAFGITTIPALYLSLALTFSSTIVVIKLLSDKNDLDTFYGRISIGVLIIQDLVALIILIVLTGIQQDSTPSLFAFTLLKGIVLAFLVYLTSKILFPILFKFVAHSQEQLFITSIAWCFLIATVAHLLGFTLEIGAFIAGLSLATLPYYHEIASKIAPLRDFFLVIFFVNLGLNVMLPTFTILFWPIILLSLFVLIGKPLIIMLLLRIFGYHKHTNFLVGSTLAQISEFSLILVTLGASKGHLTPDMLSLVTFIGIITIALSSYFISYSEKIYQKLERVLRIFQRKNPIEEVPYVPANYDTIIFGCNRLGGTIIDYLNHSKHNLLVIDLNPDVIKRLEHKKIPCIYGDASDREHLDKLNFQKAKLVISTLSHLEDSKILLNYIQRKNKNITTIVTAHYPQEAIKLYQEGASYVITPHLLSAELVVHTLHNMLKGRKSLKPLRIKHLKNLTRFVSF